MFQSSQSLKLNHRKEARVNDTEGLLTEKADYGGIQTNTLFFTNSGHGIDVHHVFISSSANAGAVILTESVSGNLIHKMYIKAQSGTSSGVIHIDVMPEQNILITCPANTFISMTYDAHNPNE